MIDNNLMLLVYKLFFANDIVIILGESICETILMLCKHGFK